MAEDSDMNEIEDEMEEEKVEEELDEDSDTDSDNVEDDVEKEEKEDKKEKEEDKKKDKEEEEKENEEEEKEEEEEDEEMKDVFEGGKKTRKRRGKKHIKKNGTKKNNLPKDFTYKCIETKMMSGGPKVIRKVAIKNGKGYKSVSHFKNGKKEKSARKKIKDDELDMIHGGKFIPGLFKDCNCNKERKSSQKTKKMGKRNTKKNKTSKK